MGGGAKRRNPPGAAKSGGFRWRSTHPTLAAAAATLLPATAAAHSFGQVYNLPIPVWLYLYGAAAALALSFVVVAWFVTGAPAAPARPADLAQHPWVQALRRARLIPVLRGASVAGLLLCLVTGFFGTRNAFANFNMTFFWIVFVLGFAYLTALVGDLYAAINPWRVMVEGIERFAPAFARGRRPYPAQLAEWPAVILYIAFIWIELFGNTKPFSLAAILATYTALTLLAVWWFGKEAWFRHGEFFAVFFRLLAKMAPLDYAPGKHLRLRAPFSGALAEPAASGALLLFVLFMLSSTAFDGLHETEVWLKLFWVDLYEVLKPWVGTNPMRAYPTLRPLFQGFQTLGLLLSPFVYLAMYLAFVWLGKQAARSELTLRELALRFAYTLLPIALVYNVTHYYTLILTQGLRIVSLISDPFGRGWNLFGTAEWLRAPIIPDATAVWHTQVALILAGHIVSVYLAHREALRIFPTTRQATLSQLPMLLLMMAFTTIGLWILSQPIKPAA